MSGAVLTGSDSLGRRLTIGVVLTGLGAAAEQVVRHQPQDEDGRADGERGDEVEFLMNGGDAKAFRFAR